MRSEERGGQAWRRGRDVSDICTSCGSDSDSWDSVRVGKFFASKHKVLILHTWVFEEMGDGEMLLKGLPYSNSVFC